MLEHFTAGSIGSCGDLGSCSNNVPLDAVYLGILVTEKYLLVILDWMFSSANGSYDSMM